MLLKVFAYAVHWWSSPVPWMWNVNFLCWLSVCVCFVWICVRACVCVQVMCEFSLVTYCFSLQILSWLYAICASALKPFISRQAKYHLSLSPLVSIIPPQCIFVNHSVSFSLARSLSFSCWHFCGPKVQIVIISREHLQLCVSWAYDVSSGHSRIRWLDSLCSSELLGISEKRRETQECKIRAWTHKGTSNPPGVSAVKGKWLIRLLKLRLDILQ